jgi:hypothetical protein
MKDVGPEERAPGGDGRTGIVPDDGGDRAKAKSGDKAGGVPDQVENAEGGNIAIVTAVPARGAAESALVGSNYVEAGASERQEDFSPTVSKLGKAVKEQDTRTFLDLEAGLEDVHFKTIDVFNEAGAYPVWESGGAVSDMFVSHYVYSMRCIASRVGWSRL